MPKWSPPPFASGKPVTLRPFQFDEPRPESRPGISEALGQVMIGAWLALLVTAVYPLLIEDGSTAGERWIFATVAVGGGVIGWLCRYVRQLKDVINWHDRRADAVEGHVAWEDAVRVVRERGPAE